MLIVEELHRYLDKDKMELMAIVACSLWLKQNAVVYGRTISPLNTVVSKAFKSLATFQSANSRPIFNVGVGSSRNLCWQAPPDGFVKVN